MTKEEVIRDAENGNVQAMAYLVHHYVNIDSNLKEAEKWAERAGASGISEGLQTAATFFNLEAHIARETGAINDAEKLYLQCLNYVGQIKAHGETYKGEAEAREGLAIVYYYDMGRPRDALQELELIKDYGRPYVAFMLKYCHDDVFGTNKHELKEDIYRIKATIENDGWPRLSLKGLAYSTLALYYIYNEKEPQKVREYYRKSAEMWDKHIGEVKSPISPNMPVSEMKKVFDKTDSYYTHYRDISKERDQARERVERSKKRENTSLTGLQWLLVIIGFLATCFVGIFLYIYFASKNRVTEPDAVEVEMAKCLDEVSQEMLAKGRNTGIAKIIPESQIGPDTFAGIYEEFKRRNSNLYD